MKSVWPSAVVDILTTHSVEIQRELRRARCVVCNRRRTLYRVVIGWDAAGRSSARCAECWGIR